MSATSCRRCSWQPRPRVPMAGSTRSPTGRGPRSGSSSITWPTSWNVPGRGGSCLASSPGWAAWSSTGCTWWFPVAPPRSTGAGCGSWGRPDMWTSAAPARSWDTPRAWDIARASPRSCEGSPYRRRRTPMIVPYPVDDLRARVMETVHEHWEAPRVGEDLGRVSGAEADRLARAALDAMLTRPFRVGVRPGPEIYDKLLRRVRRSVGRGRPIPITLGYGPMKNPNAVSDSRADWAEFFALNHLIKWHNKVQRIYPPGLAIRIVFDDSTLIMANRADPGQIASYIASIRALIGVLGSGRVLLPPMRQ